MFASGSTSVRKKKRFSSAVALEELHEARVEDQKLRRDDMELRRIESQRMSDIYETQSEQMASLVRQQQQLLELLIKKM